MQIGRLFSVGLSEFRLATNLQLPPPQPLLFTRTLGHLPTPSSRALGVGEALRTRPRAGRIGGQPLPPLAFVTPHPEVPSAAHIAILPYVDIQTCSGWKSRHKHTRQGRALRVTM